jgi:hypothetical protein
MQKPCNRRGPMKITVARMMGYHPCAAYPRDRVEALWAGRDALDALEILALDIPAMDRIWAVTRRGVAPADVLSQWAQTTADRAVRTHALNCGIAAVEQWATRWLNGEDRSSEEAAAAWAAAWAAEAVAVAGAVDAAEATSAWASAAAWAAWAAADAAVEAARARAARAARAAVAESKRQVADLVAILKAHAQSVGAED